VAKEATGSATYRGKSPSGVVVLSCNLSPTKSRIGSRFWCGFVTTQSPIGFMPPKPPTELVPIERVHEGAESGVDMSAARGRR
jgi:hypothetical protein